MFKLETQIRLALERVAEGRLEEAVDIADTVPPENADALLQVAQSLAGQAAEVARFLATAFRFH